MYNGQALEIDDKFVYLGAQFSYNGRFRGHNQRLADQARKSMFAVPQALEVWPLKCLKYEITVALRSNAR